MTKSVWRRRGDVVLPVGKESFDILNALPDGKDFVAEVRGARNIKQMRMFWALCQILADNDPNIDSKENAKRCLLWSLNYVDLWYDRAGGTHVEPRSIACESMEQEVFNTFFQSAIDKICEWLNTAPEDIRKRVAEIVDPVKGYSIK